MIKFFKKIHLQFLLTFLFLLGFGFLLVDSYKYGGFTQTHLGLDSKIIASLILVTLFSVKKIYSINPLNLLIKLNQVVLLPLLLILEIAGTYAEKYIHGNFLYGLIHLDIYQLIYLLVFSYFVAAIFPIKKKWYRNVMIFLSGLLVSLSAFLIRIKGYVAFVEIFVGDDKPIEWTQVGFYMLAAIFSGSIAKKLKQLNKPWPLTAIYIFGTLALIFLIGEEISWGQRLFGIATPEALKETNLQNEINLHNHRSLFAYVYWFYVRFTFYCSFAWITKLLLPKKIKQKIKIWLKLLAPPWYLMSFFLTSFILFYLHRDLNYSLNEFEEFNELLLAQGLFIFMIVNFYWLKEESES